MLTFKKFIKEALTSIPGKEGKGYEELHDLGDGHRVYVKIGHHGEGNYKVTALYIPPGKKRGTVHRTGMETAPTNIRTSAVHRTFGSVKSFMRDKDWNSIVLGGSDEKNKQLYRDVGQRMADDSKGKIEAHPIPKAGVRLAKKQKISNPKVSEYTPMPSRESDPARIPRKQTSYKDEKAKKYDPSGKFGPSGFKKKKDIGATSEILGGASAASSAAKG